MGRQPLTHSKSPPAARGDHVSCPVSSAPPAGCASSDPCSIPTAQRGYGNLDHTPRPGTSSCWSSAQGTARSAWCPVFEDLPSLPWGPGVSSMPTGPGGQTALPSLPCCPTSCTACGTCPRATAWMGMSPGAPVTPIGCTCWLQAVVCAHGDLRAQGPVGLASPGSLAAAPFFLLKPDKQRVMAHLVWSACSCPCWLPCSVTMEVSGEEEAAPWCVVER